MAAKITTIPQCMILITVHNQKSQDVKGHTHKHDEVNMPGLQGKDTTDQEVNDLKEIFRSHKGIIRVVSIIEGECEVEMSSFLNSSLVKMK